MASNLDKKHINFMDNVYPKNKKNNSDISNKIISQSSALDRNKKKKLKLGLSTMINLNYNQRLNSFNKFKKKYDNKTQLSLKVYKSLNNNKDIIIKNSINGRNKLVSSDILPQKSIFLTLRQKFTINSLINNFNLNKSEGKKIPNLKKRINELIYNKRNECDANQKPQRKRNKKMTRFALRNNLYYKHSSTLSGGIRLKDNSINSNYYYKIKKNKEDTKENLTKSEPSTGFNFNNVYKRNLNFPNIKINKQIINNDGKIYFNCLFSKINAKINEKKLFPDVIVKTIYNIQNDNTYKRIHLLDKTFSKLMKNH